MILAHYYTTPDVQEKADFVGDSLDLSIKATQADKIVFAGVRFMAETAKIINPEAEVILPDSAASCSLVEQTDIQKLTRWVASWKMSMTPTVHIMYINSSVEMKVLADIIVTSRNVEDICQHYADKGFKILFSPDRNMGNYLKHQHPEWDIDVWTAVCDVHDKFKEQELLEAMESNKEVPNYVIAHPESSLPILKMADYIGSTKGMLQWFEENKYKEGIVWVATEDGLLSRMTGGVLEVRQAPTYSGCQCNSCPFMKMNTVQSVTDGCGEVIDYISKDLLIRAKRPIEKMLQFERGELE